MPTGSKLDDRRVPLATLLASMREGSIHGALSQSAFGARIGRDQSYVSRIESAKGSIEVFEIEAWAKAAGWRWEHAAVAPNEERETVTVPKSEAAMVRSLLGLTEPKRERVEAVIELLAKLEEDDAGYLDAIIGQWGKKEPKVLARLARRRLGLPFEDDEEALGEEATTSRARTK